MAKKVKKVSKVKIKKKNWYKILAPKSFGQKEIGETYLQSIENAIGRSLKVNLKEITGSMKDQNIHMNFRVTHADGTTLHTKTIGFELTPMFIKKIVRKNTDRLDDFFTLTTKEGQILIVKSFMITLNKTQKLVRTAIRKSVQNQLEEELNTMNYDQFIEALITHKLQQKLKKSLSKLFPMKEVTIRSLRLDEKKSTPIKAVEDTKPEPAKAE